MLISIGKFMQTLTKNEVMKVLFSEFHIVVWRHGSTVVAMSTGMLDAPGSNPGKNHGCIYLSHRTNERI
jgi:hypothetical protein